MSTIDIHYYKSPAGELIMGSFNHELCLCDWRYRRMRATIDQRIQLGLNASYTEGDSPVIQSAIHQLKTYFEGVLEVFDIPLRLIGSAFQQKVWNALLNIPYGKTETYLGLSRTLGDDKAIRAVAAANGANALSIIVPCHRIVGSQGELTGYAGGLNAKRKLLLLEKKGRSSDGPQSEISFSFED